VRDGIPESEQICSGWAAGTSADGRCTSASASSPASWPTIESHVRLVAHVKTRGVDFFRVACEQDLEGIVAKWRGGTYQSGPRTSWLKIRNPEYSQWENRREL
jgi:hypothetical protein